MLYFDSVCEALNVICDLNNRAFDDKSVAYNPDHEYAIFCWDEDVKGKNETKLAIVPSIADGDAEEEMFVTTLKSFRPVAKELKRLAEHLEYVAMEENGEVSEFIDSLIDEQDYTAEKAEAAGMAIRLGLEYIANQILAMLGLADANGDTRCSNCSSPHSPRPKLRRGEGDRNALKQYEK